MVYQELRQKIRVINNFYFPYATRHLRILPSFIIAGVQKGGTTSLSSYLKKHPDVWIARGKEAWFFDKDYPKGLNYYRLHFPSIAAKRCNSKLIAGDASPSYIFNPRVPERIQKHLPECKIILLLRNPIDRAYSHYKHMQRIGVEPEATFEAAIALESKRLSGEVEKILDTSFYFSEAREQFGYLEKGIYYPQVRRFLDAFDRSSLLILNSEDFFVMPDKIMKKIENFLNLKHHNFDVFPVFNQGDRSTLHPETRIQLRQFFQPHNEQLFELLGTSYSWQ
jgi:hypothetical protein